MANITNYLNKIKTAVYGKDVRGAIHDAIKQVYDDASVNHDNANMEVKMARGTHNTLNDRLDKSEQKLDETNAQLSQLANKGTTVEVLERVTKEEIDRQIADGTIANLTIEDDSITGNKIKNKTLKPLNFFGIESEAINLFNYESDDIIDDKFLLATTGEERNNASSQNYSISHYIEVVEGEQYTTISSPQEVVCFYNSSKEFVSGISDLESNGQMYTFTVPTGSGIKFMRVNINKNIIPLKEYIICKGYTISNKYQIEWLEVGNQNLSKNAVKHHNISGSELVFGNLFDHSSTDIVDDRFLMAHTAEVRVSERYAISHPIPVKKGEKITGYFAQQVCCFYDANMKFISGIEDLTISGNVIRTFTIPNDDNIKYMRVNIRKEFYQLSEYMIIKGDKYPNEYISFNDGKYSISWLNIPSVSQVRDFKGKKWLTIGDSITEKNFRATKNYHDYIKEWLECEVVNVAVSGTGYIHEFNGVKGWLDRLPTFPDENEVDFITVMGALNDRHHPIGEFGSEDKTELYGALKLFYEGMIEKYPNTPIGIITSTPREYSWGKNGEFTPHVDAVIEMAQHYSLPVLDLYRFSGLRPWNTTNNKEYFSCQSSPDGDGVHPNEKGQLLMAYKIYEFINQYL